MRVGVSVERIRSEPEDLHKAEGSVEIEELKYSGDEKDEDDHPGFDTTELQEEQGQRHRRGS